MGYTALSHNLDSVPLCSPPSVTASSAFPDAKNIIIDQFSDGVTCNGSGGCSSKNSEQTTYHRSETGTDKRTDNRSGLRSCCRCDIASCTGSEKRGRSTGLRYNIGFFSTYFTIHINLRNDREHIRSRGAFILPKVHHFFESQVGLLVITKVQVGDRQDRNNGSMPCTSGQPVAACTF